MASRTATQLAQVVRDALYHIPNEGPESSAEWNRDAIAALDGLEEQYEGMKARFDSYEPGTVEGQVRAAWDLAEHHGHPEFSSKPGIVYLEEFINGLLEQLEALGVEYVCAHDHKWHTLGLPTRCPMCGTSTFAASTPASEPSEADLLAARLMAYDSALADVEKGSGSG